MKAIDRQILAIALPAIISNITTPVLGLIDVTITGHFGSAAFIGAIAVGSTMFNMLYWLFGFLRIGTAGLTSQAYGANDEDRTAATLARAVCLAAIFSITLLALRTPLAGTVLRFIDADETVRPLALAYFRIGIFGAPAVLGMYVLNGWFLGMQNSRIPMWIALVINLVNIATSLVLVFGIGMKIEGVAWGTVFAQWIGFATAVIWLYLRYRPTLPCYRTLLNREAFGRLFKINTDIFLRTLCLVAVTVWFTRAGARQSVSILAANALLMQFFMFFSYFSDGFAFAGEALSGKAYGAGDKAGLHAIVSRLLQWGWTIAAIFSVIYFILGHTALSLLTTQQDVIDTAIEFLPWIICVPLCGTVAFIYDGVFTGLTGTRHMLASMFIATAIFFTLYYCLSPAMGNHALWLSFIIYLSARGAILHLFFQRYD